MTSVRSFIVTNGCEYLTHSPTATQYKAVFPICKVYVAKVVGLCSTSQQQCLVNHTVFWQFDSVQDDSSSAAWSTCISCFFAARSVLYRLFQGNRTRVAASISHRLVASSNLAVQDPESATEHSECILVLQDADWGFEGLENTIRCSYSGCTSGQCPKSAVTAGCAEDILDPCIHKSLIATESL